MTDDASARRLRRREAELQALHAVARAGASASFDALLPEVLRIAVAATESDRGTIYLSSGTELVRAAILGDYGPLQPKYDRLPLDQSATGSVLKELQPRALRLEDWPEVCRADFAAASFLHNAIIPLHIAGSLAGTLNLARTTERPYTAEELLAAEGLGNHIALQLEKARLHADASRRLRLQSLSYELVHLATQSMPLPELVQRALDVMHGALGVDGVAVTLVEGAAQVDMGRRGLCDRGPNTADLVAAWCIREHRTLAVDRRTWPAARRQGALESGLHHALAVPLNAHERVLGAVVFCRAAPSPFGADEVAGLEGCAATLAIAIEHARLFAQERRRAHDLRLINEVGALMSAELQLRGVLDVGVRHMARIVDVPQAFLLLCEGDHLRMLASNVDASGVLNIVIGRDEPSLPFACVEAGQPIICNDPLHDPRVSQERTRAFQETALLAVPLILRGEKLGAVLLGETAPDRPFTAQSVERAQAMANQLATAVGNAKLFESLQRRNVELAEAQSKLVERERLAALGELAATVAHEVRNPLAVIFNALASLRREPAASGATPLLGIVGEEADRLNRIVGELLEFAGPAEPRLVPDARLEPIIAKAVEASSHALGARVRVEIPGPLPSLALDAQMFHQVLINLITNGAQAAPGSEITVRAVAESRDGRAVARIDVSNHGPAIPDQVRTQMFQPFFTTRARGTGLGLAIVKRIVEAHGGEVALDPAAPSGLTTFTVRVPVAGPGA